MRNDSLAKYSFLNFFYDRGGLYCVELFNLQYNEMLTDDFFIKIFLEVCVCCFLTSQCSFSSVLYVNIGSIKIAVNLNRVSLFQRSEYEIKKSILLLNRRTTQDNWGL